MPDQVLWRCLNETDFKAIHGKASPTGFGGGAMHIALGVAKAGFPISTFLLSPGQRDVTIKTTPQAGLYGPATLSFLSNPFRRRGEWIIRDQFSHRHPAWRHDAGFPDSYDPQDPPYVLVFRVGRAFSARFSSRVRLENSPEGFPSEILLIDKGIGLVGPEALQAYDVSTADILDAFEGHLSEAEDEPFDPTNLEDGRQRVFRSIMRRQGQQDFRKKLLEAYSQSCTLSGETVGWVLEAAHIVPYLGPQTNRMSNGLLLRADIHTLFDLGLIAIEPTSRRIRVSGLLEGSQYVGLANQPMREPTRKHYRPAEAALEAQYNTFRP